MKRPKVIFTSLDDTLIHTMSGKSTPQGLWDMKFDMKTLGRLKNAAPEYVFIVTNQGGIGRIIMESEFEAKLDYISIAIKSYIKHPNLKVVESIYCASIDRNDPFRKPNTGMLEYLISYFNIDYPKSEMMMIGNASGLPGQGDADIMTAKNFGIKYFDVKEFIKIYFEDDER